MLALDYYRRNILCPCGCGWPRDVSMDPMTEFALGEPQAIRCHVRTALARAQKDGKDRPTPEALLWDVQMRDQSPST